MGHYSAVPGEEGEGESLWPWGRQVLSNGDTEELPGEKAELRRVRRAWGKSPGGSTGWAGITGQRFAGSPLLDAGLSLRTSDPAGPPRGSLSHKPSWAPPGRHGGSGLSMSVKSSVD